MRQRLNKHQSICYEVAEKQWWLTFWRKYYWHTHSEDCRPTWNVRNTHSAMDVFTVGKHAGKDASTWRLINVWLDTLSRCPWTAWTGLVELETQCSACGSSWNQSHEHAFDLIWFDKSFNSSTLHRQAYRLSKQNMLAIVGIDSRRPTSNEIIFTQTDTAWTACVYVCIVSLYSQAYRL